MIIIIHGDDEMASRNYYYSLKEKSTITYNAITLSIDEFIQIIQSNDLFSSNNQVTIENLFSPKAKGNFNNIIEVLNKVSRKVDILIYSDKKINLNSIKSLKQKTVHEFKIDQNIFAFLDNISPNNNKNIILFHNVIAKNDIQIVFFMIIRQFRLMLGLLENSKNNIDELKRLAPWQKSKLIRQAEMFGSQNLKKIYKKLYKIDKAQKTGSSGLTIVQQIDMLLLEL